MPIQPPRVPRATVAWRAAAALAIATMLAGCTGAPTRTAVPEVANARSPEPGIVSAGRLLPGDVARLRAAGIRHVIDLTPDAETPGFDAAAAVHAGGLGYDNLPLQGPPDLTRANVLAFDAMVRNAPRPLLVHCASGNRVGAMAALRAAWVQGATPADAIAVGRAWGLSGLEDAVRERLRADAR